MINPSSGENYKSAIELIKAADIGDTERFLARMRFTPTSINIDPCVVEMMGRLEANDKVFGPCNELRREIAVVTEIRGFTTTGEFIGRVACVEGCPGVLLSGNHQDISNCIKRIT